MKRSHTFAVLLWVAAVTCLVAASPACSASQSQIQQTESDAFKLAGCILAEVFGGVTDPAAIAVQCVGALPSVIIDVINDFEAKPADAGVGAAIVTLQERGWLDSAKANAIAALKREAK